VNGFPQSTYQAALYECIFTENGSGFICGSQGTLLKRLPSCTANFSASSTAACTGQPVAFTNLSTGSNLTSNWWFEGGTPTTSTAPNPVVTYNTAGVYDVQLIVGNGNWTDTLLKPNYISVSVPPQTPVITANGNTLTSSSSSGNQWYLNGIAVPGATGQVHIAVNSGWYWDVVSQNSCKSDTSNNIYLLMSGTDELAVTRFSVSPVPSSGQFSVQVAIPGESKCGLSVYNSQGTPVFSNKYPLVFGVCSIQLDLDSFPPGVYTLELSYTAGNQFRKVLICK
jgi:PKD repeat protein